LGSKRLLSVACNAVVLGHYLHKIIHLFRSTEEVSRSHRAEITPRSSYHQTAPEQFSALNNSSPLLLVLSTQVDIIFCFTDKALLLGERRQLAEAVAEVWGSWSWCLAWRCGSVHWLDGQASHPSYSCRAGSPPLCQIRLQEGFWGNRNLPG
jgi:hypothetical protein